LSIVMNQDVILVHLNICPECGKYNIDYEVWWKEDEIWKGNKFGFKCPICGKKLIVEWSMKTYEYKVKSINI